MGKDDVDFKNFYRDMISNADNWWSVNGWGSKRSQYRRYTAAQEMLGINRGDCVVDIGCGSGDLSEFLWEKGVDTCYHGFDLMEEMITLAKDKHGDKFEVWDIFSKPVPMQSDWAIAIGTVGALATRNEDERWKNLDKMLMNISATVDKGFVFTMLTDRNPHKDGVEDHHWFVDPAVAVGHVLEMIPPQMPVAIRMDYHPHEIMFSVKNEGF